MAVLPTGKGFFIWYAEITEGGNISKMVSVAKEAGLSRVEIKVADGIDTNPKVNTHWSPDVIGPAIDAFDAAGISCWIWQYAYGLSRNTTRYGTDLQPEANTLLQRLELLPKVKGIALDLEGEAKTNPDGTRSYVYDVRTHTKLPLALCSYRFPSYHREFPWDVSQWCDLYMPQVYWEGSHRPVNQLNQCITEYNSGRQQLKHLPIVPVGAAYSAAPGGQPWSPTLEDLRNFNDAVKDYYKLPGISWWYWTTIRRNPDWFAEIKSHDWEVKPFPPEPAPDPKPEVGYPQAYVVNAPAGANLRSSAVQLLSNRIETLPKGAPVTVLGINVGWAEVTVEFNHKQLHGFICLVDPKSGIKLIVPT